jgi:hypothetical protein
VGFEWEEFVFGVDLGKMELFFLKELADNPFLIMNAELILFVT